MEKDNKAQPTQLPLQGAGGARERILAAVKQNQPDFVAIPDISFFAGETTGVVDKFISTLTTIGGQVYQVGSYEEIAEILKKSFKQEHRIITLIPELAGITGEIFKASPAAHHLENVEFAILEAHYGVAENGAIWITEEMMGHRALPFIAQHLAVVIKASDVIPTMHEAYKRNQNASYGFGSFISGPSKTADIEQSLVIGAHGSRSMAVFLLG